MLGFCQETASVVVIVYLAKHWRLCFFFASDPILYFFEIVPAAVCWVVRSFLGFQWFAIVGLDSRLEFSKILRISQATNFKWLRFTLTTSKLHP